SHAAVLLLTFGTGLFHYATYDACFSHIYSALGVTVLLWLSVHALCCRDGRLAILPTLVTAAILVLLRNTNGIFLLIWGVVFFGWAWRSGRPSWRLSLRNAACVGAGLWLGAHVQLAINVYANGRFVLSSYGAERFLWKRPMLLSVLCSYERGVFTYYPI